MFGFGAYHESPAAPASSAPVALILLYTRVNLPPVATLCVYARVNLASDASIVNCIGVNFGPRPAAPDRPVPER